MSSFVNPIISLKEHPVSKITPHIKLIIESSFKQNAPAPRYHARDVAVMRASIEKSTVLLSSATPSLESYRNHIQGKFEYLYLQKRFGKAQYPKVFIQDTL